ncbi:hypothetical protein [Vibrio phage vB_VhaP_PG11]|nr:hypothetical protein [Vibrio phage vB_VhaP_PG11]
MSPTPEASTSIYSYQLQNLGGWFTVDQTAEKVHGSTHVVSKLCNHLLKSPVQR